MTLAACSCSALTLVATVRLDALHYPLAVVTPWFDPRTWRILCVLRRQARLDVAHTKQAESEGGRQQALKAVQEAWKQIDDLRAEARRARRQQLPSCYVMSGMREGKQYTGRLQTVRRRTLQHTSQCLSSTKVDLRTGAARILPHLPEQGSRSSHGFRRAPRLRRRSSRGKPTWRPPPPPAQERSKEHTP
jgi:hypothetical protein